jgi:hypothetical protein
MPFTPAIGAIGFRPEFLDFERGIRVGNLEENERITRILKLALEARYGQPFVTERYGRGVFWQWIGYLNKANRAAKPISNGVSFGCSKFFLSVDREEALFKCGLQVERGFVTAPRDADFRLCEDWDWHRLLDALKPRGALDRELKRLLADGFRLHAGAWERPAYFSKADYPGAAKLRALLAAAPKNRWAGFQIFYPMSKDEVTGASGADLVDSMLAVFGEVTASMNLCVQARLTDSGSSGTRS